LCFFALNKNAFKEIVLKLHEFQKTLPADVIFQFANGIRALKQLDAHLSSRAGQHALVFVLIQTLPLIFLALHERKHNPMDADCLSL
jgi:hypothetical protein